MKTTEKPTFVSTGKYRADGRCGAQFPLESTGEPAECDPNSQYWCCSEVTIGLEFIAPIASNYRKFCKLIVGEASLFLSKAKNGIFVKLGLLNLTFMVSDDVSGMMTMSRIYLSIPYINEVIMSSYSTLMITSSNKSIH